MYKKYTQWGLEGVGSVLSLGPSRRQPHKQYISLTHAHQGAPSTLLCRIRTMESATQPSLIHLLPL